MFPNMGKALDLVTEKTTQALATCGSEFEPRQRPLFVLQQPGLLLCTDLGIGSLLSQTSFDTQCPRRSLLARDAHLTRSWGGPVMFLEMFNHQSSMGR